MGKAATISRSLFPWRDVKTLLGAALVAEVLAWSLLRGEAWRTLGFGWQFWSVILFAAASMTLAIIAGACFLRRRAQFSLRTLLFLVLLVGTGLGMIGIKLQSTEKQRRAAAALEQIGAGVSYAGADQPGLLTFLGRKHFQEPVAIGFSGAMRESDLANVEALAGLEFLTLAASLSDDDLAHLVPLKRLCTLNLIGGRVTGRGLRYLSATSDLRSLDLCRSPIDDAGLKYVGQLRTLMELNLTQTRITDVGLANLATLSELRVLYLDRNAITGEGLIQLRRLPHMEQLSLTRTWLGNTELGCLRELPAITSLNLCDTNIDDDSVEALREMSGLKTLRLHGTDVTEEGVQRLQRGRPTASSSISHGA